MQIARRFLLEAGRIGHHGKHLVALRLCHCIKHIFAGVDVIAGCKIYCNKVLMYKWELIVKIQQILVLCAVSDNRGGELFSAVNRVVQCEGQPALPYIAGSIVNVVHRNKSRKIFPKPCGYRYITVCKKQLLSAKHRLCGGLHLCIHTLYRITFRLIVFSEFILVFNNNFRIIVIAVCILFLERNSYRLNAGFFVNFSVFPKL